MFTLILFLIVFCYVEKCKKLRFEDWLEQPYNIRDFTLEILIIVLGLFDLLLELAGLAILYTKLF